MTKFKVTEPQFPSTAGVFLEAKSGELAVADYRFIFNLDETIEVLVEQVA